MNYYSSRNDLETISLEALLEAIREKCGEAFEGFELIFDQADTGREVEICCIKIDRENRMLVLC